MRVKIASIIVDELRLGLYISPEICTEDRKSRCDTEKHCRWESKVNFTGYTIFSNIWFYLCDAISLQDLWTIFMVLSSWGRMCVEYM